MKKDMFTVYKLVNPPKRIIKKESIIQKPDNSEFLDYILPISLLSPKSPELEDLPTYYDDSITPVYIEDYLMQQAYQPITNESPFNSSLLIRLDIEDLLKQEGITSINGKRIKFGNKNLRPANASYGVKNSNHKRVDPYTGNAMARDISIVGGTPQDYADFRSKLLSNPKVVLWFNAKGWGIINELTPDILRRTRGTGPHFHFGPDSWAKRTWQAWVLNPTISVTKSI